MFDGERLLVGASTHQRAALLEWTASDPGSATTGGAPDGASGPVIDLMRREQRYRVLLALADAMAVMIALALVPVVVGIEPNNLAFAGPILIVLVSKVQGLYDRDDRVVRKSTLNEWRTIFAASAIVSIAIAVTWRLTTAHRYHGGLWLFLALTAVTTVSMVVGRTIARRIAGAISPDDRCLIMGSVDGSGELLAALSGLRGIAVVGGLPMLRDGWSRSDLEHLIAQYQVHRLILVPDSDSFGTSLVETIRSGKEIGVRISIFPTVLASLGRSTTFDEVNGLPLLGVAPFGLSRSSRVLKRAFDLLIATILLMLLAPLMALIALWVRVDSPGPALFRQQRIGRDGKSFRMFKFRSMVMDAESLKRDLLPRNEAAQGLFKISLDPRLTDAGRCIRKAHMDELPQLFNVLRGEMSLVGPRPLIEEEDALFCGGDRLRLRLTPGMTGPWQIRGPMAAPLSEMARLDYLYISNWSLWRDVDILAKTVAHVLTREGL